MPKTNHDDDDAFDERGVLRDGRTMRVKMFAMDGDPVQRAVALDAAQRGGSAPLVTDAAGNALHRPGFRVSGVDAARITQNYLKNEALAAYDADLENAWRSPNAGGVPGKPAKDALPTIDTREAAYKFYDEEVSNRWRGAGR